MMELIHGDCLERMKGLADDSVDIIIADLPYGRFKHLDWDETIDLDLMWKQIWRISKPNTPIFLFGDMLFGVQLINSQPKHFKYEICWNKMMSTTPLLSKKRMGKTTEYVFVFYKKQPVYNYAKYHTAIVNVIQDKRLKSFTTIDNKDESELMLHRKYQGKGGRQYEPPLPLNVINCKPKRVNKVIKNITEKPQFLLEYILKYFSNEGDTCLDMTMGSGSCGVACNTLNRNFIGIELNKEHFTKAKERLEHLN